MRTQIRRRYWFLSLALALVSPACAQNLNAQSEIPEESGIATGHGIDQGRMTVVSLYGNEDKRRVTVSCLNLNLRKIHPGLRSGTGSCTINGTSRSCSIAKLGKFRYDTVPGSELVWLSGTSCAGGPMTVARIP